MTNSILVEIESRLQPFVDEAGRLSGRAITTDRTLELATLVGSPEKRLRVIHIAGTSGKTSTSYYIAALLKEAGCLVGLTVSPHIESIADRVQIGGRPLPDEEFASLMGEFLDLVELAANRPTYFELMMVFAFWVFDRKGVEYAVIETGLGGLHDSSNICRRPDKLAVITDIGLDHVHILGDNLTDIASQKLGIVHDKNTVFMNRQGDEVMAVARQASRINSSELVLADAAEVRTDLALFQQRNWSLAKAVYDYLARHEGLRQLSKNQLARTQRTSVPGRMEIFQVADKTVVVDGAHNEQKLSAFAESFCRIFPDVKPVCVLAVKQGKDLEQMAPRIASLADRVIITGIEVSQDMPHQSVQLDIVSQLLDKQDVSVIDQLPNNRAALELALCQSESVVLIIGSLYLAANMRQILATSYPGESS